MDELLVRFAQLIKNNSREFLRNEKNNFPANYGEKEKAESEYIRIQAYYYDKNSNEAFYDSNQDFVIQDTFNSIQELIEQQEYILAQYYIVSLELLMGMEIKLNKIIGYMIMNNNQISEFVDKAKFFGRNNPNDYKRRK